MNKGIELKNIYLNLDISGLEAFTLRIKELTIPKGFVSGLVGRNGAGKTTLIRTILNLFPQVSGEIKILDLTMKENEMEIKNRIGVVSDAYLFPESYSASDIGKRIGLFYKNYDAQLYRKLLKRLDIDEGKIAKECSQGTKAKISLAFAIACKPDLLILDEPTAHLDPVARRQVLDLLYEVMQEEKNTILFSTHITEDLDRIADYIIHIENGKINFALSKEEMLEEYQKVRFVGKKIPGEIYKYLKKPERDGDEIVGMCTHATQFKVNPMYRFSPLTVEEIMIELDEEYEKPWIE